MGPALIQAPSPQFTKAATQEKWVREQMHLAAVGWPVRAGWYEVYHQVLAGPRMNVVHSTSRPPALRVVSGQAFGAMTFRRALPTRVLWRGYLINSALFGVVLWLLVIANPVLRGKARLRRGLCPRCSYPIGSGNVCTECGFPLTQSLLLLDQRSRGSMAEE